MTMGEIRQKSALSRRIAAGEADPIRPEEREIVAGFRKYYEKKFGTTQQLPTLAKTPAGQTGIKQGRSKRKGKLEGRVEK